MEKVYAFLELFASLIVSVLFITGLNKKTRIKKSLLVFFGFFILLLITDAILWFNIGKSDKLVLIKILFLLYCFLLCACACSFTKYVFSFIYSKLQHKKLKLVYYYPDIISLIVSFLFLISMFNGMIYSFDSNGFYSYTKMYILTEILLASILALDLIIPLIFIKDYGKKKTVGLILYTGLPLLTIPLSNIIGSTIITVIVTTISILLMYLFTTLETARDLAKKELEINEKNIDLQDKQFKLVYSQIQPHFLYNVLNTIYYLVDDDVEKGKKAIVDFSDYMRMNLDSLKEPTLLKFSEELKKTEIYLSLEKLRFEDELKIEYDIEAKNFKLPQLTLQPLIENAVKHGICKKKGGGTITIYTREFEKYFEIGVIDDGVGFDTTKPLSSERSHIGLSNIVYRVEHLVNGKVEIESKVGVGTKVKIKIPKDGGQNENNRS